MLYGDKRRVLSARPICCTTRLVSDKGPHPCCQGRSCSRELQSSADLTVIWCSYSICLQKIVAFGTARSMAYQVDLKTHIHTCKFGSYLHENIPHLYYVHLLVSVQENRHSLLWDHTKVTSTLSIKYEITECKIVVTIALTSVSIRTWSLHCRNISRLRFLTNSMDHVGYCYGSSWIQNAYSPGGIKATVCTTMWFGTIHIRQGYMRFKTVIHSYT